MKTDKNCKGIMKNGSCFKNQEEADAAAAKGPPPKKTTAEAQKAFADQKALRVLCKNSWGTWKGNGYCKCPEYSTWVEGDGCRCSGEGIEPIDGVCQCNLNTHTATYDTGAKRWNCIKK